jgi:NADH-quinone oxidoreductase subunit G
MLGQFAWSHPQAHYIYWLSRALAALVQATWGEMSNGANSAGAWLAGAVPHRLPLGKKATDKGLSAMEMLSQPRQAYLLLHCEPEYDCADPQLATKALQQAKVVVALSAYDSPYLREHADVLLPVTPISESAGTYVNAFGDWQRFQGVVSPVGASRPAWKVLRVMANLWQVPHFDYQTNEEVSNELTQGSIPEKNADNLFTMAVPTFKAVAPTQGMLVRLAPISLYAVDAVTRRAESLQETQDAKMDSVKVHSSDAKRLHLQSDQKVWVVQNGAKTIEPLTVEIDDNVPPGAAVVAGSIVETQTLGAPFGMIELKPL